MTKNLKNYIFEHIKKLNVKRDDRLLVYSDLSKFGINNISLPKIILDTIKKIIGKKGTIVMPFYILNAKSDFIYDKKKFIISSKIGILTKLFLKEENLVRSNCLIHNHIGIGQDSKILLKSSENISIGKQSDFELMKNKNFKLLLLGCNPIQGATYLHQIEAIRKVPYRKWINVKKIKINKRKKMIVQVKYYSKINNKFSSDFDNVFKKIKKNSSVLKEQKIKYGKSFCISLKDLDKIGINFLNKDKYSFVKRN